LLRKPDLALTLLTLADSPQEFEVVVQQIGSGFINAYNSAISAIIIYP
jgi:hypothetical protein